MAKIKRLPSLIDSLQFGSLINSIYSLSKESGLPPTTISRILRRLEIDGIRARADYNIADLDLKIVMVELDGIMRSGEAIPLKHWIASGLNTLQGHAILTYRIPTTVDTEEVVDILKVSLGNYKIISVQEYTSTMMAKPSFQYYIENTQGKLNPKTALEANESHPRNKYNKLEVLTSQIRSGRERVTRDAVDLMILSMAEVNSLTLKKRLYSFFRIKTEKEYKSRAERHIGHTEKYVKGTRVMAGNRSSNIILGVQMTGERKCIDYVTQFMLTYFYAYSIGYKEGEVFLTVSLPYEYTQDFLEYISGMCRLEGNDIKVYPFMVKTIVARISLPYTNYDFMEKRWIWDEEELERLVERMERRGYTF